VAAAVMHRTAGSERMVASRNDEVAYKSSHDGYYLPTDCRGISLPDSPTIRIAGKRVIAEVPCADARCPNWIPLNRRNGSHIPVLADGGLRPDGHIMVTANRATSLSPRPHAIGCWAGMSRKSQQEARRSPRQPVSFAE